MTRRHHYEATVSFSDADYSEVDVTVSYAVAFDDFNGDEVEDIRLEAMGGKPAPFGLHHHSDKHFEALVAEKLAASEAHAERMIGFALEAELEVRVWEDRREEAA